MRQCSCGDIKGRYLDNTFSEVSQNAVSLAIGNGSLFDAVADMRAYQSKTSDTAEREEYYQKGKGLISHAWVRPNTGLGNPHCKIIEE